MPVLIDENIEKIEVTVTERLRAIVGVVDQKFQGALLTSGRLLFLVDRYSEQNETTQKQILELTGTLHAAALIVMSRTRVDLEVADQTDIAIKPLDGKTLPLFLSRLVGEAEGLSDIVMAVIVLALFRIASLSSTATKRIEISPLLAKMFFELSYKGDGDAEVESTPPSLPEIYFRYVLRLDASHGASNRLSDLQLRQVCVEIGRLALTPDYRPSEFRYEDAKKRLQDKSLWKDETNVIDRLINNGILRSRVLGTQRTLRFELDTMAETFWLYGEAEECASDEICWSQLVARLRLSPSARSLLDPLRSIHASYAEPCKWARFPGEPGT